MPPRKGVIHYGNDLYCKVKHPDAKRSFQVTYWDLWFAIVLIQDFGGDWERMIGGLRERSESHSYLRDACEGFVNHLRLLHQALDDAKLSVDGILAEAGEDAIKSQKAVSGINSPRPARIHKRQSSEKRKSSTWTCRTPS